MRTWARIALVMVGGYSLVCAGKAHAADPKYSGNWAVISEGVLADLAKADPRPQKPFEKLTAGIAVDRSNGDVYMMANNTGICKSTDQGATFKVVSGKNVTGRFEYGWSINVDPMGKRLMCFAIYGSSASSDDAGATWTKSKQAHMDFGAVDWADTGKTMLSIGHESGGKLLYTNDITKEWQTLGKDYSAVGLFDSKTLMSYAKGTGIVRSTDSGKTWNKVSDEKLAAPVMVEFKGVGYWLGESGLLESKDKGQSWTVAGELPKGAVLGPMFGKDQTHMVVGCPDGLYESTDSGKTWVLAVPLAPEIKILKQGQFGNYGWDPIHNIFYASKMDLPAYKFVATSTH